MVDLLDLTKPAPTTNFKIPRSVLVLIHTPQLDVLLIERCDGDALWQSVTGSLDDVDEPLKLAAQRELAEETGFEVSTEQLTDWHQTACYEIFPRWRHRYAPGVSHNQEHLFSVCLAERYKPTLSPREHRAFEWLTYQQAAQRCFSPSNCQAILQLPERMKHFDITNIYLRKV